MERIWVRKAAPDLMARVDEVLNSGEVDWEPLL